MGNIRYQRTAHRTTSAVNGRPLKPPPRSICPAAPYPTGVHIPGIPPPAKFATEPLALQFDKAHRRPGRRIRDPLGVAIVVLLRLDVGPDIFGRHQPDIVA